MHNEQAEHRFRRIDLIVGFKAETSSSCHPSHQGRIGLVTLPGMTTTMPEVGIDESENREPGAAAAPRRTAAFALATAFGVAVTLVWVVAGVHASGRGLNPGDESFYLLSYRWWDVNLRNFTGMQYVYGPVFEILGHDIAALRLFRISSLIAVHLVFGWSLMAWLRTQRSAAAPTRLWEAAGIAAVVATGGLAAGWLPLTPGYNDLAVLGALLAMTFVLFAAAHVARGRSVPWRLAAGYGALVPLMLLAKWGSVTAIAVTGVAAAAVLWRRPGREIARLAAAAVAGAAGVLGTLAIFVPVHVAVRNVVDVNRVLMAVNPRPMGAIVELYLTECFRVTMIVLDRHALLLVAAGLAVAVRWLPALRLPAALLAVVAFGLSVREVTQTNGVHGGAGFVASYVRTLVLPLLLAAFVVLVVVSGERIHRAFRTDAARSSLTRSGPRGWVILGALVLLPLAQAAGTTTTLLPRAAGGFAAWTAVLIVVLTGIDAAPAVCRWLLTSVLAATMVAASMIALGGLWRYPYRTFPYPTATTTIAGAPSLASLRFNPATADAVTAMHRALRPWVEPQGRAMIGFPMAVLALGGRPVGEAYTSSADRIAAGIRQECRSGKPFWGDRPPVLLYVAPPTPVEIAAFRTCGIDLATDYRRAGTYPLPVQPTWTVEIQAWVPVTETAARRPPAR